MDDLDGSEYYFTLNSGWVFLVKNVEHYNREKCEEAGND